MNTTPRLHIEADREDTFMCLPDPSTARQIITICGNPIALEVVRDDLLSIIFLNVVCHGAGACIALTRGACLGMDLETGCAQVFPEAMITLIREANSKPKNGDNPDLPYCSPALPLRFRS